MKPACGNGIGVHRAAAGGRLLGNAIVIRGHAIPDGTRTPVARLCAVSEGYVKAMGMRLVGGRDLERADVDSGRTNVLVNEAFASRRCSEVATLSGARFGLARRRPQGVSFADGNADWEGAPPWLTVVGVVANTPFENLTERANAGGRGVHAVLNRRGARHPERRSPRPLDQRHDLRGQADRVSGGPDVGCAAQRARG